MAERDFFFCFFFLPLEAKTSGPWVIDRIYALDKTQYVTTGLKSVRIVLLSISLGIGVLSMIKVEFCYF